MADGREVCGQNRKQGKSRRRGQEAGRCGPGVGTKAEFESEPPEARTLNLLIKRHGPSPSLESDEPISWSDVKRRVKHLFVAGWLLLMSVSKLVGKMLARTVP